MHDNERNFKLISSQSTVELKVHTRVCDSAHSRVETLLASKQ